MHCVFINVNFVEGTEAETYDREAWAVFGVLIKVKIIPVRLPYSSLVLILLAISYDVRTNTHCHNTQCTKIPKLTQYIRLLLNCPEKNLP